MEHKEILEEHLYMVAKVKWWFSILFSVARTADNTLRLRSERLYYFQCIVESGEKDRKPPLQQILGLYHYDYRGFIYCNK